MLGGEPGHAPPCPHTALGHVAQHRCEPRGGQPGMLAHWPPIPPATSPTGHPPCANEGLRQHRGCGHRGPHGPGRAAAPGHGERWEPHRVPSAAPPSRCGAGSVAAAVRKVRPPMLRLRRAPAPGPGGGGRSRGRRHGAAQLHPRPGAGGGERRHAQPQPAQRPGGAGPGRAGGGRGGAAGAVPARDPAGPTAPGQPQPGSGRATTRGAGPSRPRSSSGTGPGRAQQAPHPQSSLGTGRHRVSRPRSPGAAPVLGPVRLCTPRAPWSWIPSASRPCTPRAAPVPGPVRPCVPRTTWYWAWSGPCSPRAPRYRAWSGLQAPVPGSLLGLSPLQKGTVFSGAWGRVAEYGPVLSGTALHPAGQAPHMVGACF